MGSLGFSPESPCECHGLRHVGYFLLLSKTAGMEAEQPGPKPICSRNVGTVSGSSTSQFQTPALSHLLCHNPHSQNYSSSATSSMSFYQRGKKILSVDKATLFIWLVDFSSFKIPSFYLMALMIYLKYSFPSEYSLFHCELCVSPARFHQAKANTYLDTRESAQSKACCSQL